MSDEIKLRIRDDLEIIERRRSGQSEWIVKDPISFAHFRFSHEEICLLNLFDGQRTLQEVQDAWRKQFQTGALTRQQVKSFADRLVRDNLVLIERVGTGKQFVDARLHTQRRQRMQKLSSPLVIKGGGVDPQPVLEVLSVFGKILFSRIVVALNLLFAFVVFAYLFANFEEVARRLPTMSEFFAPKNLIVMTAVLVVIKVLHELGHGLACKKFGGECIEIGVIFLAFIPTLYCDVSDAWMFRERWKRIMVSFAGIYVEIILASICAIIWLMTEPGFANSVVFNVAIMCSLNTIFMNGNPLLKYDGYYIVSDWFEQPNLAQQARLNFRAFVNSAYRDIEEPREINGWLVLFGGLSTLYRWFIVFSIVAGVYVLIKSLEVGYISELIAILLISTTGVRMLSQQFGERKLIKGRVNWYRAAATSLALVFGVFLFFAMPLPTDIYCKFEVQPRNESIVYAPKDGKLQSMVVPELRVQSGDLIAEIEDPELEFQLAQSEKTLSHLREKYLRLERQRNLGELIASQLKVVENEIGKQQRELELLKQEADSLSMQANRGGVVRTLASIRTSASRGERAFSPMLPENNLCFVRRGQPLFSILDDQKKLIAVVGERNVEFLEVGQSVSLVFNQNSIAPIKGVIEEIVEVDVHLTALEQERMGLDTTIDQTGNRTSIETPYRLMIAVDNIPAQALVGSAGQAKIAVQSRTAAQKIWYLIDRWWNEQNY